MLVNVSIAYYSMGWKELTNEEWDQAAQVLGFKKSNQRPVEPPLDENGKRPFWSPGPGHIEDQIVDATSPVIAMLLAHGIEINLKPYKNEQQMVVKLQNEIDRLKQENQLVPSSKIEMLGQGAAVITHVPNLGLLLMNEVDVLVDCCTKELQEKLDEGWHMLAVCPPNAKRRPDYILGRNNPKRTNLSER